MLLAAEARRYLRIRFEATQNQVGAPDGGEQPRTPTDAKDRFLPETVTRSHAINRSGAPFGQEETTTESDTKNSEPHFRCSEASLVLVGDTGINQ